MPTQIGENRAKKMLKANELVLCMGVNQLRTPNIAMIAAACGFDAVYIDLEHNPTSLETAAGVCVAALGMGITRASSWVWAVCRRSGRTHAEVQWPQTVVSPVRRQRLHLERSETVLEPAVWFASG